MERNQLFGLKLCRASYILMLGVFAVAAGAQEAGPTRVQFRRGTSSSVLRGQLRGREDMEYAVGARGRQMLSLQLTAAPPGSLELKLWDPAHRQLTLKSAGQNRWNALLPQDGDYEIWVVRLGGNEPASTYRLQVAIH